MKIIVARLRKSNLGFGFGVWRNAYQEISNPYGGPLWTFAIGPFTIHARFTKDKDGEE